MNLLFLILALPVCCFLVVYIIWSQIQNMRIRREIKAYRIRRLLRSTFTPNRGGSTGNRGYSLKCAKSARVIPESYRPHQSYNTHC